MKRLLIMVLIVIIIFQTSGCFSGEKDTVNTKASTGESNTTSLTQISADTKSVETKKLEQNIVSVKIGWKFLRYSKTDENDVEYPYTEVFIVIEADKKQKIKIGSYIGNAYTIEDFSKRDLPKDTLLACASWWAGGGDDICVTRKDNSSLSVMWRPIVEVGDDVEYEIPDFKEILVAAVPEDSKIEVLPLTEESKDILSYTDNPKDESNNDSAHPIIINNILMGGFENGKWVNTNDLQFPDISDGGAVNSSLVKSGDKLKLYTIDSYLGESIVEKVLKREEACEYISVDMKPQISKDMDIAGVGVNWNALPSIPKEMDVDQGKYIEIIKSLLDKNGLKDSPVIIKKVYSVDIDGDKSNEELIQAMFFKDTTNSHVNKGDYSLLVLHKALDGKSQDSIIFENYYKSEIKDDTEDVVTNDIVSFILDLNGDGKMEVSIKSNYYEGISIDIYSNINGIYEKVISYLYGT